MAALSKGRPMKKGLLCLLCLALALCVLHGCKFFKAAATGGKLPDSVIASEISARIAQAGLPPVRVFVLDGRVTLSGAVPSQEVKQKMIAIAKSMEDVSLVTADLRLQKVR
jgi:osmotically-inducible protein OsmY